MRDVNSITKSNIGFKIFLNIYSKICSRRGAKTKGNSSNTISLRFQQFCIVFDDGLIKFKMFLLNAPELLLSLIKESSLSRSITVKEKKMSVQKLSLRQLLKSYYFCYY